MLLHIVGTGCPDARADRYGSSFILEIGGRGVMVDCGPATTCKMARMGIDPRSVDHLFFTHHHYDHNADFPCFVLTCWDQCRGGEAPLEVYGPPPTEAFVEGLIGERGVFAIDWKSRIEHPASHFCHTQRGGSLPRPPPAVHAHDVAPGPVAKTGQWTALAARVKHVEPTMISLAYRFDTEEGSVVFAGDCADCEELRELARGAGTLVMACTYFANPPTDPALADVITGTPQAAAISREAGVKRVILTHMSPNFSSPGMKDRAVAEVARSFEGEILCPDELATVEIRQG